MMTKFRTLLYREWRISRKKFLFQSVGALGLFLLYWLIGLSCKVGNLKDLFAKESEQDMALLHRMLGGYKPVYVLAVFLIMSTADFGWVHTADLRCGWLRYSYTMPVSAKMRAAVHWTMLLLVQAAIYLLNVVNLLMSHVLFDLPVTAEPFLVFALFSAVSLLLHLGTGIFPLSSRTESECSKRSAVSGFVFIAAVLLAIFPLLRKNVQRVQELQTQAAEAETVEAESLLNEQIIYTCLIEPFESAYNASKSFIIPGIFVLTAAGYVLTVKAYERREAP